MNKSTYPTWHALISVSQGCLENIWEGGERKEGETESLYFRALRFVYAYGVRA